LTPGGKKKFVLANGEKREVRGGRGIKLKKKKIPVEGGKSEG